MFTLKSCFGMNMYNFTLLGPRTPQMLSLTTRADDGELKSFGETIHERVVASLRAALPRMGIEYDVEHCALCRNGAEPKTHVFNVNDDVSGALSSHTLGARILWPDEVVHRHRMMSAHSVADWEFIHLVANAGNAAAIASGHIIIALHATSPVRCAPNAGEHDTESVERWQYASSMTLFRVHRDALERRSTVDDASLVFGGAHLPCIGDLLPLDTTRTLIKFMLAASARRDVDFLRCRIFAGDDNIALVCRVVDIHKYNNAPRLIFRDVVACSLDEFACSYGATHAAAAAEVGIVANEPLSVREVLDAYTRTRETFTRPGLVCALVLLQMPHNRTYIHAALLANHVFDT